MPKIKLDPFEKDLVRMIKFNNPSYKFKFDDLQEWSSSKDAVLKNLREDDYIGDGISFIWTQKGNRLATKYIYWLEKIGINNFDFFDESIGSSYYIEI